MSRLVTYIQHNTPVYMAIYWPYNLSTYYSTCCMMTGGLVTPLSFFMSWCPLTSGWFSLSIVSPTGVSGPPNIFNSLQQVWKHTHDMNTSRKFWKRPFYLMSTDSKSINKITDYPNKLLNCCVQIFYLFHIFRKSNFVHKTGYVREMFQDFHYSKTFWGNINPFTTILVYWTNKQRLH